MPSRHFALDRREFAEVYLEFGDPVFGACVAILRDRDEAADATRDVFVLAQQRGSQLRERERLRAWLFAIARHVCFRRLHEQGRTEPVESLAPVADDAAALVWAAAAGLSERDRAVLFNVVQGLDGDDLAAAIGVQHAHHYAFVYRAKAHLDEAVGALAVSRFGRRDCGTLDALLGTWDGTLTPVLRKRIGRHVDVCTTCMQTKLRAYKAPALTAGLLSVAGQARALTASEIFERASHGPVSEEVWQPDGFPPLDDPRPGRRRLALLSFAALGLGALLVLLTSALGGTSSAPKPLSTATAPAHAANVPPPQPSAPAMAVGPPSTMTVVAGVTAVTPTTTVPVTVPTGTQPLIANIGNAGSFGNAGAATVTPFATTPAGRQRPAAPPVHSAPVSPPPVSPPPVSPPPVSPPPVSPPPVSPPPVPPVTLPHWANPLPPPVHVLPVPILPVTAHVPF